MSVTRTQLFGPDDLEKVKEILGSYDLKLLSTFLGTEAPAAAPTPEFREWFEGSQFDERFFGYLDFMLTFIEKPLEEEKPLWDRMARLAGWRDVSIAVWQRTRVPGSRSRPPSPRPSMPP